MLKAAIGGQELVLFINWEASFCVIRTVRFLELTETRHKLELFASAKKLHGNKSKTLKLRKRGDY